MVAKGKTCLQQEFNPSVLLRSRNHLLVSPTLSNFNYTTQEQSNLCLPIGSDKQATFNLRQIQSGPEVRKLFSCSTVLSMKF